MSRKQLWLFIGVVVFMMVWGFDLIARIKFGQPIRLENVFNLLTLSQTIYSVATLVATRWVFKNFYLTKKYLLLVIGVAGLITGFAVFRYLLEECLYFVAFGFSNYTRGTGLFYYFLDNVYYGLIYIFLGISIFFIDEFVRTRRQQLQLIAKNREAELAFLRSQINPHFLFNTLNNIYSLSYKQSPKAPEAILKLSELMRYMLYEKKEKVPLQTEWNYVQHFISLQQIRYDYPINLQITAEGLEDNQWEIPPYLLIAFVENIFKHGDFTGDKLLVLHLVVTPKNISFYAENIIGQQQKDQAGGIGLENIQRRLELLYPNRHHLELKTGENKFIVSLQINNS